jgi:DNA-binding response OmpR family regulator
MKKECLSTRHIDEPKLLIAGAVEDDENQRFIFERLTWPIQRVKNCLEVFLQVRCSPPRVVVCERDLPDGSWKDVLDIAASVIHPPPVIVTSRLADDYLWAEVLNLGGYDVLAKPLDRREVTRTLTFAWDRAVAWDRAAKAANPVRGGSKLYLTA